MENSFPAKKKEKENQKERARERARERESARRMYVEDLRRRASH